MPKIQGKSTVIYHGVSLVPNANSNDGQLKLSGSDADYDWDNVGVRRAVRIGKYKDIKDHMHFVDTHCHIQSAGMGGIELGEKGTRDFWAKAPHRRRNQIVADAALAGVTRMVCVGCDLPDSQLAVSFVEDDPSCFASIGLHPHEAKDYADHPDSLQQFAELVTRPKVIAVGECGLDYYYGHSPQKEQEIVLRFQIELALEHNLPLIFHVRDAFDDFWPIFDSYKGIRGVLHSFTDTRANLDRAIDAGLYIGVNGIATFTKNKDQVDMYKSIPLSRLLLETDAPFLTPSPYRGTICEPYHTKVTAEFLSELRDEPLESLAAATTDNAEKLFRL